MVGRRVKSPSSSLLAGIRRKSYRKRDVSARYSVRLRLLTLMNSPLPSPERRGGNNESRWHHETPLRPANGPGRILFSGAHHTLMDLECTEVHHVRPESDPRTTRSYPHGAQEPPTRCFSC